VAVRLGRDDLGRLGQTPCTQSPSWQPEQRRPSAGEHHRAVVPVTKLHARDQVRRRLPCHDAAQLWRVLTGSQGRACGPRYALP